MSTAAPTPKGFSILHEPGMKLPWAMVSAHAGQANRNHYQSVERLHERGGLSWCEVLAVLEDRKFTLVADAREKVAVLVDQWQRGPDGENTRLREELSLAQVENVRLKEELAEKAEQIRLMDIALTIHERGHKRRVARRATEIAEKHRAQTRSMMLERVLKLIQVHGPDADGLVWLHVNVGQPKSGALMIGKPGRSVLAEAVLDFASACSAALRESGR